MHRSGLLQAARRLSLCCQPICEPQPVRSTNCSEPRLLPISFRWRRTGSSPKVKSQLTSPNMRTSDRGRSLPWNKRWPIWSPACVQSSIRRRRNLSRQKPWLATMRRLRSPAMFCLPLLVTGDFRASVYRVLAAWNSLGLAALRFSWPRLR